MKKPRVVKAIITRTVVEKATVVLDQEGNVEEIQDIHEEISWDNAEVHAVTTVITEHP
ncbi:hypothetical protein [Brevibacillus migulae]|uniref:hypothetical protein n=1 Tax=Brevibacillus migulae TaxID=1644114 RepID=UPI00142FEF6C|nr:hypothetical protein [Brevibacillus migulae]